MTITAAAIAGPAVWAVRAAVSKIMERRVNASLAAVIIALPIGVELRGIVGALLTVPIAANLPVLVQELTVGASRP